MDHAVEPNHPDVDEILIYTGGRVPQHLRTHITHVIVDLSTTVVDESAFSNCTRLRNLDCHQGVERIQKRAFVGCTRLRVAKLRGVKYIELQAFDSCTRLVGVEFSDDLRTIGYMAFDNCNSLRRLVLTSVVQIEEHAFENCGRLTDVELPEGIDVVRREAFSGCINLRRIAIPLKIGLFPPDSNPHILPPRGVFAWCNRLSTVELVGGIHQSVSNLSLDHWKFGMSEEFDRINEILLHIPAVEKTTAIVQWMESVLLRLEHYKYEHHLLLRESAALLELALWKANLDEKEHEDDALNADFSNLNLESSRKERRVTSGAGIVIKGVLPFLRFPED